MEIKAMKKGRMIAITNTNLRSSPLLLPHFGFEPGSLKSKMGPGSKALPG
jgi:hypothetical protein